MLAFLFCNDGSGGTNGTEAGFHALDGLDRLDTLDGLAVLELYGAGAEINTLLSRFATAPLTSMLLSK